MDPSLLNATGLAFTAIGATVLFATLMRRPGPSPIALLGYLALMDGFFLQFIASLETMRLSGLS